MRIKNLKFSLSLALVCTRTMLMQLIQRNAHSFIIANAIDDRDKPITYIFWTINRKYFTFILISVELLMSSLEVSLKHFVGLFSLAEPQLCSKSCKSDKEFSNICVRIYIENKHLDNKQFVYINTHTYTFCYLAWEIPGDLQLHLTLAHCMPWLCTAGTTCLLTSDLHTAWWPRSKLFILEK